MSKGVAAIILAAGESRRLGRPKQLVLWHGETLLDRAVRVAREADCSPVVVVLGASFDEVRAGCRLEGALVVVNESWREGMASSVRAGIAALEPFASNLRGALLLVCDQPAVTAEHLKALAADPTAICASSYAGRNGVPAFFPPSSFAALAELHGDAGARSLLQAAQAIELPGGEVDIDTAEDLAKLGAESL